MLKHNSKFNQAADEANKKRPPYNKEKTLNAIRAIRIITKKAGNQNESAYSIKSSSIINRTADYVKKQMEGDSSGHDWWHVWRVCNMAVNIAKNEEADLFTVQLAALLHDLDDYKLHNGSEISEAPVKACAWLTKMNIEVAVSSHVCEIIRDLSFKGKGVESIMATIEGKVVQDADRLDAIGAIGIARTFAYGGAKGREMYNPDIQPMCHNSFEEYKNSTGPTLNHFDEKLLHLKDLMNTESAKNMARERHDFMEDFKARFLAEWEAVKHG